jgi:tetratricopeptide (TPR) repeat protein/predicted Ser/Thr protein kinase
MIAHYKVLEEIGQGGLGVVYKAEDTKLKRTVALKFLKVAALGGEEHKVRFAREAQAAAALSHPSICTVYEIGEHEGKAFIAMAYIEGVGLDERIAKGPLPVEDALSIAVQVGEGLQEAHEQGIVHRDIKSGNIRITPKGRAKILDFGLARIPGETVVTQEGVSMGTVSYMSPEQARGAALDHRTDIWSFGVMLYEMIVGRLPFKGDSANAVIYSILNETPDPLTGLRSGIPLELERIVTKALAKDPAERYQHMDEMLVDLRALRKQYETGTVEIPSFTTAAYRPGRASLLQELMSRRVLLTLVAFVVVAAAAMVLTTYVVDSFPVSPRLPRYTLVFLITLLPAVILLAYHRGRPGEPRWSKSERIGVPVNVAASVLLLLFLFQGEPLATTTTVTTTDEEGRSVEVEVPRQEFRKRIAIFYFSNDSGRADLDWLQFAVPQMLHYDLLQDIYIDVRVGFLEDLRAADFANGLGAPVALMRRIAEKANRSYFIEGSISARGDELVLTSTLHRTGRARPVAVRSFTGADVLGLVDELTVSLKQDLDIPAYHIEAAPDHALSEILTDSPSALREFGLGMRAEAEGDREAQVRHLEASVSEDPTFTLAQWELSLAYNELGRAGEMKRSLMAAMQHIYKLPTFYQYVVKCTYHETSEDIESAREVAKDWVKLYPQSIDAHEVMAAYHEILGDLDGAIEEWNAILELDPERHDVLRELGDVYARKGEFERGLEYLEQYRDLYPEDYRSYSAIGALYSAKGEYVEAKRFYENARRREPGETHLTIRIADLEKKLGNFEQARQELMDAVSAAKGARERSIVYSAIKDWYKTMGRIGKALEYLDLYVAEVGEYQSPVTAALQNTFMWVELYAHTENFEAASAVIDELEAMVGEVPLLRFFPKYTRIWYYSMAYDRSHVEEAEDTLVEMEAMVEKNPTAGLEAMLLFARAGVHALREEFAQAAEEAEKAIPLFTMLPQDQRIFLSAYVLGHMYRRAERYDKAEEAILSGLRQEPSEPFLHAMLGLTYYDMGRAEDARSHLGRAMEIWKDADPDFKPAREPREALTELEESS